MELGWEVMEQLDCDGWFGLGAALGLTLEHWRQALCIQWRELCSVGARKEGPGG